MAVNSMTGYAQVAGGASSWRWRWEARSVNGRGLDLRLRLPDGWDALEPALRTRAGAALKRGSVTVSLRIEEDPAAQTALDPSALAAAMALLKETAQAAQAAGLDLAPTTPERLLAMRGVVSSGQARPDEATQAAALADAEALLSALGASRAAEGAALETAIRAILDAIAAAVDAARAAHAAQLAAAPDTLRARVAALLDAGADHRVASDRLATELALLAVRSDVAEEIARLDAHIAAARALLDRSAGVGRELDFLTQEFNREANTLCSKADSAAMTEAGLGMKVLIDRMREQAANVE